MTAITPFKIDVPQNELDDLQRRLSNTRWPEAETPKDWSQGVPLAFIQDLCRYWQDEYDWRRCEAMLNSLPQFKTEIDGLGFHFIHVESPHPNARPVVMTHGWPGSIIEFMNVIGPLTDPPAHGGSADDALHVVLPSMPGFGFSDKPAEPGWGIERIGQAWGELMARLGYDRYFAQGGDWGSIITHSMVLTETEHCAGAHVNFALPTPSEAMLQNLSDFEEKAVAVNQYYWDHDSGYSKQQSTRPQTIGYSLVDSPSGLLAWITDKIWSWTNKQGDPRDSFTHDQLIDNAMMYWLPACGASAARIYWESLAGLVEPQQPIALPFGVSVFPNDLFLASERWYKERCSDLRYFNVMDAGGHFSAWECPEVFVDEVRKCFRTMSC